MTTDEISDRFAALETLTVQLVRTLHRTGVLPDADRDQILDSLEEICSGDVGETIAADELCEAISPRGASVAADFMSRLAYKRRLYGSPA